MAAGSRTIDIYKCELACGDTRDGSSGVLWCLLSPSLSFSASPFLSRRLCVCCVVCFSFVFPLSCSPSLCLFGALRVYES